MNDMPLFCSVRTQKSRSTPEAIDPNIPQRHASDPDSSVWVNASAGTGKTKVLTDRVLRLLLPRNDGTPGTQAYRILGLTFTKAAASEMALRIHKTLGRWSILPEEELKTALEQLTNTPAKPSDIKAARQLFTDVTDAPGGLKIMTIHAFCQSILQRFPLEAGLAPYFKILKDDQALGYMHQARNAVLNRAHEERSSPLSHAFLNIASTLNEQQFEDLLNNLSSERYQLQTLLQNNFGLEGLCEKIYSTLNVAPQQTPRNLIYDFFNDTVFDEAQIKSAANIFSQSKSEKEQEISHTFSQFLAYNIDERCAHFEVYKNIFLTKDGARFKNRPTKKIREIAPYIDEFFEHESVRLQDLETHIKSVYCAQYTSDLIIIGHAILEEYQALKDKSSTLDFTDLILKTRTLIRGETHNGNLENAARWVLYKLDEGIEHILVDEAQDTNPDQWNIIETLCDEFFVGEGAHDVDRSLFVVGDEKQSIYSFQRASPEEFNRMRQEFASKIQKSAKKWQNISLNVSFRSTKCVLDAVDAVFSTEYMKKMLSNMHIEHHSHRVDQDGIVELWPLCESEQHPERDPWAPPIEITNKSSGRSTLATNIAQTIKEWIDHKEILPSRARPIRPGDIMILMRTRNQLVNDIVKALKNHNIPVSGVDRMVLNTQLVIQDLLATIEFVLLPRDDLTLACILKSPLIGLCEDTLFALCHDRPDSLWDMICDTPEHQDIMLYLKSLLHNATNASAYSFLKHVLQTPCPADNISGLRAFEKRLGHDSVEAIDELLSSAMDFGYHNINDLQGFIQWQHNRDDEIKRELENAGDAVRIMTIHGAKGLQAPIVIMPDTTRTTSAPPGKSDRRLLWPDKSGLTVPLWSPRKNYDCTLFSEGLHTVQHRLEQEYTRLLYVAMTRAEDRLYICGYKGARDPIEASWYNFVRDGLKAMPDIKTLNDGTLRHKIEGSGKGDRLDKIQHIDTIEHAKPEWLYTKPKDENDSAHTFTPSRIHTEEEHHASPLNQKIGNRFRRGNITHKLLEILPDIAPKDRRNITCKFLARYADDLSAQTRDNILEEVINIFENSAISPLLNNHTQTSKAEVAITGKMKDGRIINGQIDRLIITDDAILIIDYKTNRPPPNTVEEVPAIYHAQIQAYADTLRDIYPKHAITGALLWTDGPKLMTLPVK